MSRFFVFLVLLAMVVIIEANNKKHHGSNNHGKNNDDSDCDNSSNDSSSADSLNSDSSSSDSLNSDSSSSNNWEHHSQSKNHKCHKHEYWAQCGKQCEPTCDNKSPNHHFCQQSKCTAGCRCQQGYVRYNGGCVHTTYCPNESSECSAEYD